MSYHWIKFCVSFFKFTHTQLSPFQVTSLELCRKCNVARFDLLAAMLTFPFFLGIIQFILVYAYQRFGRVCCFYLQSSPRRVGIPPGLIGIGYPHDRIFGLTWKRRWYVSRKCRCLYTSQHRVISSYPRRTGSSAI